MLGCAGLTELVDALTDALGVPVVDGVAAATTAVEGLLAQGTLDLAGEHLGARAGGVLVSVLLTDVLVWDPTRASGMTDPPTCSSWTTRSRRSARPPVPAHRPVHGRSTAAGTTWWSRDSSTRTSTRRRTT